MYLDAFSNTVDTLTRLSLRYNPRVDSYRGFGNYIKIEEPKYDPYLDVLEKIKENTDKIITKETVRMSPPTEHVIMDFVRSYFSKKYSDQNVQAEPEVAEGTQDVPQETLPDIVDKIGDNYRDWLDIKETIQPGQRGGLQMVRGLHVKYFGEISKKKTISEIKQDINNKFNGIYR